MLAAEIVRSVETEFQAAARIRRAGGDDPGGLLPSAAAGRDAIAGDRAPIELIALVGFETAAAHHDRLIDRREPG